MSNKLFIMMLLALAYLSAPAAHALESDASQPVKIAADRWDHNGPADGKHGVSIYTGHVVITQGSIRITAHKATLTIENGTLSKAVIVGQPAHFHQARKHDKPINGHADTIVYTPQKSVATLTGHARVDQSGRVVEAHHIRYDTGAQQIIAKQAPEKHKRVHVVIPSNDVAPTAKHEAP